MEVFKSLSLALLISFNMSCNVDCRRIHHIQRDMTQEIEDFTPEGEMWIAMDSGLATLLTD